MENLQADVLVIGAGASGLLAALEIAQTGRSVILLDAKDRVGGRIHTIRENDFAYELGAEFVHGDLPITQGLIKKAGLKTYPVKGSIWQYKDGHLGKQEDFIEDYDDLEKKFGQLQTDKSIAAFLAEDLQGDHYEELRFSLKNYVEGYDAADIAKASTYALRDDFSGSDEDQYRLETGYGELINYLEKTCKEKGVQIFLSHPVWQLHWKKDDVTAVTEKGSFTGKKVLLTVPIGILQKGAISFHPALPQVKEAAMKLGFGQVIKLVMTFEDAFWKDKTYTEGNDLTDLNFLFSGESLPTWWTYYPKDKPVITAWLGGPRAKAMQFLSQDELVQKALASLGHIFNKDVIHLQQKLQAVHHYNWAADNHFCGAYSYEVVDGEQAMKALQQPIEETIFFAGEGLHHGPEIGTVEAAFSSGRETAYRLITSFSK